MYKKFDDIQPLQYLALQSSLRKFERLFIVFIYVDADRNVVFKSQFNINLDTQIFYAISRLHILYIHINHHRSSAWTGFLNHHLEFGFIAFHMVGFKPLYGPIGAFQ